MIRRWTGDIGVQKIDGGDVVNARPAFVFSARELSLIVFLSMASNLSWCFRSDKVP